MTGARMNNETGRFVNDDEVAVLKKNFEGDRFRLIVDLSPDVFNYPVRRCETCECYSRIEWLLRKAPRRRNRARPAARLSIPLKPSHWHECLVQSAAKKCAPNEHSIISFWSRPLASAEWEPFTKRATRCSIVLLP